jgi:hypothetical protein
MKKKRSKKEEEKHKDAIYSDESIGSDKPPILKVNSFMTFRSIRTAMEKTMNLKLMRCVGRP